MNLYETAMIINYSVAFVLCLVYAFLQTKRTMREQKLNGD